jgi:hypothetical protein
MLYPITGYEISRNVSQGGFFSVSGIVNTNDTLLTHLSVTDTAAYAGQHVLSNPYASGLSIGSGLEFGGNMQQTVYLFHTGTKNDWKSHQGGNDDTAPGQYLAVPQQQAGIAGMPDTIASMQGFVVRVDTAIFKSNNDLSKNSLKFKYDYLTQGNSRLRSSRNMLPKVYSVITLSETNGDVKDRLWLFADRKTSRGYDNGYDGYKIFGEAKLARLYTKWEGRSYQVSAQPGIDDTWMNIKAETGISDYTLTFRHNNLDRMYNRLYLFDAETGTTTDITADSSTYRFTAADATANSRRFLLTTKNEATSAAKETVEHIDIYYHNGITVNNQCPSKAIVRIYDMQGQLLHVEETPGYSNTVTGKIFTPGIYIVRAVASGCAITITKKVVVSKR